MKKIIFNIIIILLLFNKIINSIIKIKEKNEIFGNNPIKILSNKKNAILGIIVKYSWKKILPFIKSVLQANFNNCDIIMFISGLSQSVINNLKSFGVKIYNLPIQFNDVGQIYTERWKIYLDFLNNNKDKYNLILSVDVKDTIFQREFFSLYENYEQFLGFSLEELTIDNSIYKYMIKELFGIDSLNQIKNKRIINAGTIWGTINSFIKFSSILYNKLLLISSISNDQSIINYLIYYENILSNCLIINSDGYGSVMTLGLTKRNNIRLDNENNILNYDGQVASIIHQYDRHPHLKKIIIEKFCPELINFKIIIKFFIFLYLFLIFFYIKSIIFLFKIKRLKNTS